MCDGFMTPVSSILRHANSEKENMQSELSPSILGKTVKLVYGERAKLTKKGPRHVTTPTIHSFPAL